MRAGPAPCAVRRAPGLAVAIDYIMQPARAGRHRRRLRGEPGPFTGNRNSAELQALHDEAHTTCFLANSVKTVVHCVPG